jgi:hypothetical protein
MKKLRASQTIPGIELTVGDFWAWAYSDLMVNTVRSIFAEFIVGTALGVIDQPRLELKIKASLSNLPPISKACASGTRMSIWTESIPWNAWK